MNLNEYIASVDKRYRSGISGEHAYRGDLEILIRELTSGVEVTNEPTKVTDCGNPDFVITKGEIPIGFIEAKDVGKDLASKVDKEQFDRYRKALDNLIITDYLWFRFYQNGELIHEVNIGEIVGNKVAPLPGNFATFTNLVQDFCTFVNQTIKSPKKLAVMMADKARLLENILEKAVTSDERTQENTSLKQQYQTFKNILIHDLTPEGFADIYAQTLAYGMFAARLHDKTLDSFSRQEAAELIPKSNPFLRKLFNHVAGPDIDRRIVTTVDNLADVFRATNVSEVLKNFGKITQTQDPIIHFYETFLAEYNPKLRKARGVWYTPEPVVKFIVRGVDEILKADFGLNDGLADTSKTTIQVRTDKRDRRTKSGYVEIAKEVHKVQVLDPATGTGTFLAEVVRFIYENKFSAMQGAWSGYVEEHLIPRLNGFELLMASYAMAHLKLDMLLSETSYQSQRDSRFNIFLTNSLEEFDPNTPDLFSVWLSTEAKEANHVKRETPVMVVMGNPPYSVSSSNNGEWIQELIKDYKKDLNERKINLDDDYIKFIRYGQQLIEKNETGILAYITNNSFLDGITHRQMRKSILETFDKIYILDLHGNSKKKETAPDGSRDENVFDIMQGVSINLFIKLKSKPNELAEIFHFDSYGKRTEKYDFLKLNTIKSIPWNKINFRAPEYFYVPKDFKFSAQYDSGFSISELFKTYSTGIETKCDNIAIRFNKQDIQDVVTSFKTMGILELEKKYTRKNSAGWNYKDASEDISNNTWIIAPISYRPFDIRFTAYTGVSGGFMGRPRPDVMQHLLKTNLSLISARSNRNDAHTYFVSSSIADKSIASSLDNNYVFPLYLHPDSKPQSSLIDGSKYQLNLHDDQTTKIAEILGLKLSHEVTEQTFTAINLFDYIYAVIHSPSYRQKYKEFLKIDFPRIPYPKDQDTFLELVKLGGELREIHLLESSAVEDCITTYPHDGDNTLTRKIVSKDWELYDEENQLGRIWINDQQCFEEIPLLAWEFYIGGYQPAQKWLKDRKERTLSFDDIQHYQKIIVALNETHRLMQEIDKIEFE
ncbi:MAG: N-6 DNA methylase [Gammaproteobacteria bacterium]|nr:N-6 DNA methylase [Gammaproteobacteria bacterium]